MKSLPFFRTLIVFCIILLLAVFVFVFYFYNVNKQAHENTQWIIHNNEILYKSGKLLSYLKDTRTTTQEYLETGDSTFLTLYFAAKDSVTREIDILRALTNNNASQQNRIDKLASLINKRWDLYNRMHYIGIKNNSKTAIDSLRAKSRDIMGEINDTLKNIQAEEHQVSLIHEDNTKQNEQYSAVTFFLFIISLIALIITAFFILQFFSKINKDENNVLANAQTIFFSKRIDEIVKGISDPLFSLNKAFCFVFYNEAARKILAKGKKLAQKNFFETFPQYQHNIIGEKIKQVMFLRKSVSFEALEIFNDQWLDITIYPTSEGVSVYMKDATARKENEMALQEAQHFLELTNKLALVGGWEMETVSEKVKWTPNTREIFETQPDFVLDFEHVLDFFPEESREALLKVVNNAIQHHVGWDIELPTVTAKGNEKWIRTKGEPIIENDICVRLIGSVQDIDSKRMLYNHALKNEQRFRSAFENSMNGMVLADKDGLIIEVNQSFCDMLGYSKEALSSLRFDKLTYSLDRPYSESIYKKALAGIQKSWRYKKRYLHKEGYIVWVELSGSVITDKDENVSGFLVQLQKMHTQIQEKDISGNEQKGRTILQVH
ncbi:PAS domain S-box protein [Ferruginibacter albus]|uniref:PAS domain S-box protein n=1 Tax=Ferruginibacter albus TaxID=2875540 RepID=UPI001CC5B079|nr:PAS domain S-box protein [Ferruginibacter albus]UAY52999.1 PAS domain S-box protein [Ferruginibacter albus]